MLLKLLFSLVLLHLVSCKPHGGGSEDEGSLDVCSPSSRRMKWPRVYYSVKKGDTCEIDLPKTTDGLTFGPPRNVCKSTGEEQRICSLSLNETKRIACESDNPSKDHFDLTKVDLKAELFHGSCFTCPEDKDDKDDEEEEGLDKCEDVSNKYHWEKVYYEVEKTQSCADGLPKSSADLQVGSPLDICKAQGDEVRVCTLSFKVIKEIVQKPANDTSSDKGKGWCHGGSGGHGKGGGHHGGWDLSSIDKSKIELKEENFKGRCIICPAPQAPKTT